MESQSLAKEEPIQVVQHENTYTPSTNAYSNVDQAPALRHNLRPYAAAFRLLIECEQDNPRTPYAISNSMRLV